MNQRIYELRCKAQELAAEAFPGKIPFDPDPNPILWDRIHISYEKFAELIVKECVDKVDKTGFVFNEQPQYNDKQNALVSEGFFWALESVKQQIREHFGVDE